MPLVIAIQEYLQSEVFVLNALWPHTSLYLLDVIGRNEVINSCCILQKNKEYVPRFITLSIFSLYNVSVSTFKPEDFNMKWTKWLIQNYKKNIFSNIAC
jgi:hypothetical protein